MGPALVFNKVSLTLASFEVFSPIMHFYGTMTFANNAVSMAADIIRESCFM